ncbi:MAG: hypothetical protein A2161_17280 [Candidatus Schekmanbacteria bacterium RBG_13_48_7]|uniref:Photosynthesis system II assembly factor Ycf48/Hcf136-like domain-containing protein n=1 Tax=Candidatus Schekmanbacteria bacterium RBG_13_48_7 TaxID=1817878 RepID=A0A1F7RLE8_9BACT|nr:MAG: hypothetical protein A2161_17280 [Candidatus Schekmanbacteria bacterium RBG_13_48_7]
MCNSWEEIPVPNDIQDIYSLAVSPESPDTIYLGTYRLSYRTSDSGQTWQKIDTGMKEDSHIFKFVFSPANPLTLFSATCGWVYKSTNSGDSWKRFREGLTDRRVQSLAINPIDPKILIAGTCGGAFKSNNNGTNWKCVTSKNLIVKCITFSSMSESTIFLGSEDQGIFKSTDMGDSFREINRGFFHHHIPCVVPVPSENGMFFTGIINAGNKGGLYASIDGGKTWEQVPCKSLFKNVYAIQLQNNPFTRLYVGTENGVFWKDRGAMTWNFTKSSRDTGRIQTLLISADNPNIIITGGNNGLFLSKDSGSNFTKILPELTSETFFTLSESNGNVYAGSNLGLYRSPDSGQTWIKINSPFSNERIQCILQDPLSESHLYVGTFKGLYHGNPIAEKWNNLDFGYGIPDISDIKADPFDPNTLIVSSYLIGGVYVSNDRGLKWDRIDSYYDPVRAFSLVFDPFLQGRIYLGTYGHSIACNNAYRKK